MFTLVTSLIKKLRMYDVILISLKRNTLICLHISLLKTKELMNYSQSESVCSSVKYKVKSIAVIIFYFSARTNNVEIRFVLNLFIYICFIQFSIINMEDSSLKIFFAFTLNAAEALY